MVVAACEINRCAKPRAVNSRAVDDVDDTKCDVSRNQTLQRLFVNDTIVEFGEFGVVPAVGRADEITGYAL